MQRTLRWFEARAWRCAIVERYIAGAGIRRDAFGCDLLIAHGEHGIALVQVCGEDVAAHLEKLKCNRDARTFVHAGGEVLIVGWRELKAAGGWTPRIWCMSEGRELELEEVLEGLEWQPRLIA
jgi:hypothetical protein